MKEKSKQILLKGTNEKDNLEIVKLLSENGYKVVRTFTKDEVVHALREEAIDIAIINLEKTLYENDIQFLREILSFKKIPVIFLDTYFEKDLLESFRSINELSYAIEHFTSSSLLALVDALFKTIEIQIKHHRDEGNYRMIVESSPEAIFIHTKEGNILYANSAGLKLIGADSFSEIEHKYIFDFVDPSFQETVKERIEYLFEDKQVPVREERLIRLDKTVLNAEVAGIPISFDGVHAIQVIARNITGRKQLEMLEKVRNHVLDQLIAKKSLDFVLEEIIKGIESIYPDMMASILLLDQNSGLLKVGASSSLPEFFNSAIDGLAPGLGVGSCGTAVFLGQTVIVEDVMTHPYWKDYRELAARANLKACWSEPFKDDSGKILGTFAAYYKEIRSPQKNEISMISEFSKITGLAVQSNKSELERIRAEEEVKTLLIEKEILLKEVHHRIKNNMASVSSLLSLQADYIDDPKTVKILEEAQNRILSMMLIYDKLYKSTDYKNISIQEYLYDLIDHIFQSFPERSNIEVEKDIEDFVINSKSLFSVGIIINELITNAFKYAFPDNKSGKISLFVRRFDENKVELSVSDDGIGISEKFSVSDSKGFGLNLIHMLTKKKGSSFEILREDRTIFKVIIDI